MKKTLLSLLFLTSTCALNAQTTIVDVTNPTTGATWMDRNLGATQAATSSTDAAAYGDLYQWGRAEDGHQLITSSTTSVVSATYTPGHADFIINSTYPNSWVDPLNDNLWQGMNGINNPCPSGYRIPTTIELDAERATWSSQDFIGAFNSILKLPVAGYRDAFSGATSVVGATGYYYSSNVSGDNVSYLAFNASVASIYSDRRGNGMCIRCIKDASAGLNGTNESSFSIYPNPATNNVTIESNSKINSIQIVELTGALVQTETHNSFSIEQLTNGVYLMNINTEKGTVTKRLIKE